MVRLKYTWWLALATALLISVLFTSAASANGYNQPHQYPGGGWHTVSQDHSNMTQTMRDTIQAMQNMTQAMHDTTQTMQNMMQTMRSTTQRMQTMDERMQRMDKMMQRMHPHRNSIAHSHIP